MKAFGLFLLPTLLVQMLAWGRIVSAEAAVELGTSRAQEGQGLAQVLEGRGSHGIREHDDAHGVGAGPGRGEKNDVVVVVGGFRVMCSVEGGRVIREGRGGVSIAALAIHRTATTLAATSVKPDNQKK